MSKMAKKKVKKTLANRVKKITHKSSKKHNKKASKLVHKISHRSAKNASHKKSKIKKINETFATFEEKVDRLKQLEYQLKELHPQGFDTDVRIIKSKLKDPTAIPEIERLLRELKNKMLQRKRSQKRNSINKPLKKIQSNIVSLKTKDLPQLHNQINNLKKAFDEKEKAQEKAKAKRIDSGVSALVEDKYDTFMKSLKMELSENEKKNEGAFKERLKRELETRENDLDNDYKKKIEDLKDAYDRKVQAHLDTEVARRFKQEVNQKIVLEKAKLEQRYALKSKQKIDEELKNRKRILSQKLDNEFNSRLREKTKRKEQELKDRIKKNQYELQSMLKKSEKELSNK